MDFIIGYWAPLACAAWGFVASIFALVYRTDARDAREETEIAWGCYRESQRRVGQLYQEKRADMAALERSVER